MKNARPPTSSITEDPPLSAEDWFARLHAPDCGAAEHEAFERWRDESPAHDATYREVQRIWERTAVLRFSPDIARATEAAMYAKAKRSATVRRWSIPAAAAAVALIALALSPLAPWAPRDVYETASGEQRRIMLADGSRVLLDAESELAVRYGEQQRRLVLKKGQAQFKVERDAQRPFIVQAADGTVKALGTEFQVRVIGKEVLVTLLEGKVAVEVPSVTKAAPQTLTAGQQLAYNPARKAVKKREADLEVAKGWTYGDLVFKRWRLDDLVAEMNRYSTTKLVIEDPALGDLVVSGRFHAGDHQSLILALENDWPVRASTVSPTQVALYRR